jgi:hypothetical protein
MHIYAEIIIFLLSQGFHFVAITIPKLMKGLLAERGLYLLLRLFAGVILNR